MRPELEVEIVSDDEMAIIEAALAAAAARPLLSSAVARGAATFSCAAYSTAGDIEDSAPPLRRSLLSRFRERRALAVTDITATVCLRPSRLFASSANVPRRRLFSLPCIMCTD
jgi:exonuclease V